MSHERLGMPPLTTDRHKYLAGHYLQTLAVAAAAGIPAAQYAAQSDWTDRAQIVQSFKAAVDPVTTDDLAPATPAGEAFLNALRPFSIPLQLADNLHTVPLRTRVLISSNGGTAVEIVETAPIPASMQSWTATTLEPRFFGAINVVTNELLASTSAAAAAAIQTDLAGSLAAAENIAFLQPALSGSILNAQTTFVSAGTTQAQTDTNLSSLVNAVPAIAAGRGGFFVMTAATATALSLMRTSGGAVPYPAVGPAGGFLLGLPVLISSALQPSDAASRVVALISPSEIFYADGDVILSLGRSTTIQQSSAPTTPFDGSSPIATPANTVSMFQNELTAVKAIRSFAWRARPNSQAYYIAAF